MRAMLLVMLVACGAGAPKEQTLSKEQQAKNCRVAVDHLVELMTSGDTGGVPMADRIRTALFDRCTVDKWGVDATQCFATISTIDKAETCARFLTVPQRDGFQQAVEGAAR